jgi:hypothetical protein
MIGTINTCLDVFPVGLQVLVSHGVQFGHVNPQVCRLEQVLHLFRVRVESGTVNVDVWRQHPVDDGSERRGRHARVPRLADHLVEAPRGADVNAGKGLFAVVGKVPVDLPRDSPVVGLFDKHGRRPKRLEGDDQVGHVELGFQVELDRGVLLAVVCLPPRSARDTGC